MPRPFHLQLESNAAAAFPLVKRFGRITIDIYPRGFRAKSIWLRGFALNGRRDLTVENPFTRTYTVMPVTGIGDIVRFIGGKPINVGPPLRVDVSSGRVRALASRRFRFVYGANDFIDVWTTNAIGPAPAFRACIDDLVRTIAPPSAAVLQRVPDTPIYVELNIGKYRKLPILRPVGVVFNASGESDALRVGPWMFPAPFGSIFK